MSELRSIEQIAEQIERPIATLYDWRYKGIGPRSAKLGGRIVYRQSDVDAWIEAQFAKAVGDELAPAAGDR